MQMFENVLGKENLHTSEREESAGSGKHDFEMNEQAEVGLYGCIILLFGVWVLSELVAGS